MPNLKTYLKFLSRNKLYTFVSIVGFSISLMFVIILGLYVKQELSTDDFQENKDRIFLMTHDKQAPFGNTIAQYVRDNAPEVESFARIHSRSLAIGQKGNDKVEAQALFADSTFFRIFSFPLIEGDPERVLEARKSVVITRTFAAKIFGSENPVGKSLFISDEEHTITGIMEDMPVNSILLKADFVANYNSITIFWDDQILETPNNFGFNMFFLTRPGTDLPSKAPMLLKLFKEEFWYFRDGYSDDLEFMPLKEAYFKAERSGFNDLHLNSRSTITIYMAIAILVLVIALLNYINLTVAQAGFRGKESAIKKLLGSSKANLVSQLLAESLLITTITFLAGLLLAFLAEPFFNNVLNTTLDLAHQFTPSMIAASILFLLIVSFLAGIIPALIISNFNPLEVVKGTFSRKVKSSYSKGLIIFQYTVATALLICAIFIQQQSVFLINYDMGYNREGILEISNTGLGVKQIDGFKSKLLGIPGVELVSFSSGTPLNGGENYSYTDNEQHYSFQEFRIDSAFLQIYGITIEPTGITPSKNIFYWLNRSGYKAVEVDSVTQTFRPWGNENQVEIAGIFSDFKIRNLYRDYSQLRIRWRLWNEEPQHIIVKMTPGTDYYATAKRVEKEYIQYTEGELFNARFVDEGIQQNYESVLKMSSIMSAFTLLTIIIMVMGVFAMSLYLIRQKEKEIALRKINGATEEEVMLLLNRDSLKRVAIAFVIACPVAYYVMTKWFEDFSYKIELSWWVFVVAGLAVLLLTLVSVSYMTWKAARANPVESLKGE
ncbi:Acidobacterial duplicated orphan permease [Proteiniphilum saccharofermentans]|uniref:Acidobacterial duplicated orphan permease n=1 Tax=Proteiniphilum saccharofermentans TaxID=1642647 RepID=A0A1R3TEP9_9BACT|nr:FtsX-like permease family protein [Proteiniphilum saccharofermentans]SCD22104.1 Acidobacterial duplicated orphan permease [Proteiniphilum saccharofermentans]